MSYVLVFLSLTSNFWGGKAQATGLLRAGARTRNAVAPKDIGQITP